ncbi:MAG: hypothetical protein CSA60_01255 [Neptuniibacter caesariensis]|uniref:Imelysin-like domain-containing protein n=1 Tax=Neptuniibacter caesariensis TaxID=207954 RepID=A0A2G6JNY5_NEPCE|nr:MAG: hypothetical protein CSA60_01255 [Neptuniibacter caesariensis]
MSLMKRYTAMFGFLLISGAVSASVSQEQWRDLNQNIVNDHVLPVYQDLAKQSGALEKQTQQLCKVPTQKTLDLTRTQFKHTLDAWEAAQHINFGPIELLMRNFSIQFWPDKKNLTSKQLNKLLAEKDPNSLTDEALQTASIAVKGLPAIERILYAQEALTKIQQDSYRCQLLHAVSNYVKDQSKSTYQEWQSFKHEFDYVESEDGLYGSAQAATVDLMKALIEPLAVVRDLKILHPLGTKKAKPRRLENWRSQSALRNLQTNISTLHHMYSGISGVSLKSVLTEQGAEDLATDIENQFILLEKALEQLPAPLSKHIHEAEVREQLFLISEHIEKLGKKFAKGMKLLEIQLGFNSRDGD